MLLSKNKIMVNLMGGLGNQMFQYAMGRHLSLKNNLPLSLNTNFFENDSLYKRSFELSVFNIEATIQKKKSILAKSIRKLKLNSLFRKAIAELELFKDSEEYEKRLLCGQPVNKFDRKILDTKITKNTEITGYWQSEEYFAQISNVIRKDFSPKHPISHLKQIEAEKIVSSNAVGIGVRQYNETAEASKHFKLTADYYSSAISLIEAQINNPVFFVFTLDFDWAKMNIKTKYPIFFIDSSIPKAKSYEDLYLMSLCKHFIIPNSTFHWWGAWLSQNKNTVIIVPKLGWGNTNPIPKSWIMV